MNLDQFALLSDAEKQRYQSHRTCPECESLLIRTGHSTGDLHTSCPSCRNCPDCEDGSLSTQPIDMPGADQLVEVFRDGKLLVDYDFTSIRERAKL